jgi:hypothetical protein
MTFRSVHFCVRLSVLGVARHYTSHRRNCPTPDLGYRTPPCQLNPARYRTGSSCPREKRYLFKMHPGLIGRSSFSETAFGHCGLHVNSIALIPWRRAPLFLSLSNLSNSASINFMCSCLEILPFLSVSMRSNSCLTSSCPSASLCCDLGAEFCAVAVPGTAPV